MYYAYRPAAVGGKAGLVHGTGQKLGSFWVCYWHAAVWENTVPRGKERGFSLLCSFKPVGLFLHKVHKDTRCVLQGSGSRFCVHQSLVTTHPVPADPCVISAPQPGTADQSLHPNTFIMQMLDLLTAAIETEGAFYPPSIPWGSLVRELFQH